MRNKLRRRINYVCSALVISERALLSRRQWLSLLLSRSLAALHLSIIGESVVFLSPCPRPSSSGSPSISAHRRRVYGESGRSLQRPRQDSVLSHSSSFLLILQTAAAAATSSSLCGSAPGQEEDERAGQEWLVHASERDTSPGLRHVQRLAL